MPAKHAFCVWAVFINPDVRRDLIDQVSPVRRHRRRRCRARQGRLRHDLERRPPRRWRAPRNSQRSGVRCTRVRRTYFRGGETPRGMRGVIGKQAILEVNGFTRLRRIDRIRPATTPSESSPVEATTRTNPTTITSQAKLEDGPCAIPRIPVAIAKTPVAISRRVTLHSKRPALRPISRLYARQLPWHRRGCYSSANIEGPPDRPIGHRYVWLRGTWPRHHARGNR